MAIYINGPKKQEGKDHEGSEDLVEGFTIVEMTEEEQIPHYENNRQLKELKEREAVKTESVRGKMRL
ncbi:unnamed protein product [Sphagnum balticum]